MAIGESIVALAGYWAKSLLEGTRIWNHAKAQANRQQSTSLYWRTSFIAVSSMEESRFYPGIPGQKWSGAMPTIHGASQLNTHLGLGLAAGGALFAIMFSVAIFWVPMGVAPSMNPLWIIVAWGTMLMCWGVFRMIAGPSRLDHFNGGTNAGS